MDLDQHRRGEQRALKVRESAHTHTCVDKVRQECKVVTWGLNLDEGIICPPVFSFFSPLFCFFFFVFFEVEFLLSAHPKATNYNSHVTRSTQNKS